MLSYSYKSNKKIKLSRWLGTEYYNVVQQNDNGEGLRQTEGLSVYRNY